MAIRKLLFVDTNILLDQYRGHSEPLLSLLKHVADLSDLIVTYQLEIEFKANRQNAILAGMGQIIIPDKIPVLGIFSDGKINQRSASTNAALQKHVKNLKDRLALALIDPAKHDPVYKVCQRIFRRTGKLSLTHASKNRSVIRRKAWRRFVHGCPPRKKNDTFIGDAINWEWMLHCAEESNAELVICSRDKDYGATLNHKCYVNDHLQQEFRDRVSRKRKIVLCDKLSDALKEMKVPISKKERQAEKEIAPQVSVSTASTTSLARIPPARIDVGGAVMEFLQRITNLEEEIRLAKEGTGS
jgi:hypothetical protein